MQKIRKIVLAGGCFWGTQAYFRALPGVLHTDVVYVNGLQENTSYEQLKLTEHAEAVYIEFNSFVMRLQELILHLF